jgi:hypothetical protein
MFGTLAFSMAFTMPSASLEFSARGFSQRIILPAFAAAMAISACRLFGTAMSTTSMSLRAMSFFQSVSTDS